MEKISCKSLTKIENTYHFYLEKEYKGIFGFGEKFNSINQKGNFVRAIVKEKCFYQGENTYLSMPFFFSSEGFGVYVDTYVEVDFDFRKENLIDISFKDDSFNSEIFIYLFKGTPKEILKEFRSIVGFPKLFPKWVLGSWMSSNRWRKQEEIYEQLELNKKYDFPHNVLVIEPWSDLTTRYSFMNSTTKTRKGNEYINSYKDVKYEGNWPNPKQMIDDIHDQGLHLLLWLVPIYAQGHDLETSFNKEQCLIDNEYVKENKYVAMKPNGEVYVIPHTWCVGSMIIDFTNPKACDNWFNHFKYLLDMGVDGFKTDGGEFVHEEDAQFFDKTTGFEQRNKYSELYLEKFSTFVGDNRVIFSRAGGQKAPSNSLIWGGDQESTWSEFNSMIKALISSGCSGISTWGYDISGFSGYLPSKELYLRSVMMASLIPIMQWHSDPVSNNRCDFTGAYKINDRSPWNIAKFHKDESIIEICRKYFYLHYNLLPYQYSLMQVSHLEGTPAIRHLVFEYTDEEVINIEDEFMIGPSLLAAPILEDYKETRRVYIPENGYINLFSKEKYSKGYHDLIIKEDEIPLFMRPNSIVPLNLNGQVLMSNVKNDLDKYVELTFLVSGKGNYLFKDDLGNEINITWDESTYKINSNKSNSDVHVLHIEKDKLFNEK